jgi:hypothetical protein
MKAAQIQQKIKVYQLEKDKLRRFEKTVETLIKDSSIKKCHIQLSGVIPAKRRNPYIGNTIYTDAGPLRLAPLKGELEKDTELNVILGSLISDIDAAEIAILLYEKQKELVITMEKDIKEAGIEL